MWFTLYKKTFQVRDIRRWTALIRGRKVEESRLVAFTTPFVKFFEQISFDMYFYVRELIELIWIVLI